MQSQSESISIFNYQSPRQYVLDQVKALQKQDPSLSVRMLARKMGMKSHALLLMLLQGKREIRVKHASQIAKGFGLSSQERLYLQALIQFDSAEDLEEKNLCQLWLSDLHPEAPLRTRELEEYELVSNWLHTAILAISELKNFDPSAEAIAERLGSKTNVAEVRAAIERLKSRGLIKIEDGGRFRPTYNRVTTADDVANQGARKYHRSTMKLADQALDQPLTQREYQSFSMAVPAGKMSLAKEMIRKFRSQFAKAIGQEPGDEVYQMNIQFFQLTESPARMGRVEDEGVDSEWNQIPTKGETHDL